MTKSEYRSQLAGLLETGKASLLRGFAVILLAWGPAFAGTSTTALISESPSAIGDSVTFTATVAGSRPTGAVTFKDGGIVLGTATMISGVATFSVSGLARGAHAITAMYNGDVDNASSAGLRVHVVNSVPLATPDRSSPARVANDKK